jgi:hypothetical protein
LWKFDCDKYKNTRGCTSQDLKYIMIATYVYVHLYIYTCICTITTKAYTADSSALGTRCACWCALFFFMKHIFLLLYYQHAFKHRPLVPSAVEPPVLLHYSFYVTCTTISKVLQCLSAHIYRSSVLKKKIKKILQLFLLDDKIILLKPPWCNRFKSNKNMYMYMILHLWGV